MKASSKAPRWRPNLGRLDRADNTEHHDSELDFAATLFNIRSAYPVPDLDVIAHISKKVTLREGTSCSPCRPDAPRAYNVNSTS